MSEANSAAVQLSAEETVASLIGERLTLQAFHQLAGVLAGYPFVKIVVDRQEKTIHFVNNARYQFHLDYIGERILKTNVRELESKIDDFNRSVYFDPQRRFYLGIAALHARNENPFFTLETVEVDTMDAAMLKFFYDFVKKNLDPGLPLLFKPANHLQEEFIAEIDAADIPRIYSHEIFASAKFIALNKGKTAGRLRFFKSEDEYRRQLPDIEWHDILVMARVPDDIPRVAGIINTAHTTPLSHTNVLASGWQIPNAIQIGIEEKIEKENLDSQWVRYEVDSNAGGIILEKTEPPADRGARPVWYAERVKMDQPETVRTPIEHLKDLRLTDRFRYGTKAANLGELNRLVRKGSSRLLGFYQISRPPRENLLPYLAEQLKTRPGSNLEKAAWDFLKSNISIPRGIAIPFSIQQEFLQGSPQIQQQIGKLKMALELRSKAVEPLCLALHQMITAARIPDKLRDYIDSQIVRHLGGVSSFVVRSSSNAEDLENFSAAGIYESINQVATSDRIFDSIRTVWASLVSPRSTRLRDEAGISLDDSYMGVIIQEEVSADMGGVMITKNPANSADFRNIYINVSSKSVVSVVQGSDMPYQFLYNTVEGGGRTLSLGSAKEDLNAQKKTVLAKLALAGRLLQSHFSQDYTFANPLDIEWAAKGDDIYILQARPYAR
ncbi:MAG: phosphoenolpyruvate synthase [Elusimicrobia bacterium]|nr:phosphoenolpyruvate synthase [Elusimicrobiota bacterium]